MECEVGSVWGGAGMCVPLTGGRGRYPLQGDCRRDGVKKDPDSLSHLGCEVMSLPRMCGHQTTVDIR